MTHVSQGVPARAGAPGAPQTTGRDPALSLAPRSLGLAWSALAITVFTMLLVAVLGGSATMAADKAGADSLIGILLSTVGVVFAGICVYVAITAVQRAQRATRQERLFEILTSRASAASSRERSLVAFGLVVALLIGVAIVVLITMNDGSIQKTFLRWDLMVESSGDVVKAFGVNIFIAVIAEIFVLGFGLVLAVARMMPGKAGKPVRALAIAYIDIMRAVPAVIVLYLVGFGLPLAGVPFLSGLSPVWFAILALALTYSAYVAETIRAGIEQIHPSQSSASRSLGFSYGQTLRFVVLPQAIRAVIPPLLGTFIALQKDTSLVNIIGTMDAFNQAKFYASSNFNLSSVTVVAVLFVVITIPQTRFVDWMLERGNAIRRGGSK